MIKCNELYNAEVTYFQHPGENKIVDRENLVSYGLELANNTGKSQKVICHGDVFSYRKGKRYPNGLTISITKDGSTWAISDWEHKY